MSATQQLKLENELDKEADLFLSKMKMMKGSFIKIISRKSSQHPYYAKQSFKRISLILWPDKSCQKHWPKFWVESCSFFLFVVPMPR